MTLRGLLQVLKRKRRVLMKWGAATAGLCALTVTAILAWPMDTSRYLSPAASPRLLDRNGHMLHAMLNENEEWCFPIELESVSPRLIEATLAAEDQRFYEHCGVDLWAVGRAMLQNIRKRGVHSGASTISMQVIKLAEGRTGRSSIADKIQQMTQAVRLELRVDKDDILQAYLNLAPYNGNTRGCEAASRRFFGKPSIELTMSEAALLAGLPKAPSALDPLRHPDRAAARWRYVVDRMRVEGIDEALALDDSNIPLHAAIHNFPRHAPHFALRHAEELIAEKSIRSTFDIDIQTELEAYITESTKRLHRETGGRVSNCAAIVLDAPSASVLAWVGSGDFNDTPGGGQFDAAHAVRPPGSTLKPFLYALAMSRSELYPSEILLDAPMDKGLYNPRNFDEEYRGHVRADDALRDSLNIPALSLLHRVGVADFHASLKQFGFAHMENSSEYYGLGLVLGNSGAELAELAEAYAVLANRGMHSRLQWRQGASTTSERILPSDICMQINSILRQPLIDSGIGRDGFERARLKASWKTGTSSGRHDAWTILYNRRYVVAVWVGNNDYTHCDDLVGSRAALPLATRIFRDLPRLQDEDCHPDPDLFHPVHICCATGLPAGDHCRATRETMLPDSIHTLRACDVHHAIGESWPIDPVGWDLAATPRESPVHNGELPPHFEILRPASDAIFIKTGSIYGDRIALKSSLDGREPVHWYLNGHYIGTSRTDNRMTLDLNPGQHHLSALTDDGRSDFVAFAVQGSQ